MRMAGRRTADSMIGGRSTGSAGYLSGLTVQGVLIAIAATGLFWLVWIYASGLRDPRYLDGWVLASGMVVQLGFHIAIKTASLSPRSAKRWRTFHVFLGYVLIAAFVSHSDFSLPDTAFEWVLWAGFVLVTLTGIFGTYLAWSLQSKHGAGEPIVYDRIPARRAELARDVQAAIAMTDSAAPLLPLPPLPYDAWITDLYANHLKDFFAGPRNVSAHLVGSQYPLKRLTDEIEKLSPFVDKQGQEKLTTIKALAIEKDQLDFARVHHGLTKGWLFVHVPVTYALIVLTTLHIVVVYSFSSGSW